MIPPPHELLSDLIKELHHSLEKSKEAYEAGKITKDLHETHIKNITKHLETYTNALNKLLDL